MKDINRNIWLITLPHAGGSTALYKGFRKKINCNILNIEYPGHWTRMNEPIINSYYELKNEVMSIVLNKIQTGEKVIIFGHSLGAILGWDIVPALLNNKIEVKALFLSGSQNPGSFPEKAILRAETDDQKLELIGFDSRENSKEINKQFMKTFFPILKNDIEVCKNFSCDNHYVDVDTLVLYGSNDRFTNVDEIIKWKKYTRIVFMKEFCGGHLFIEDKNNMDTIIEMLNRKIQEML